MAPDLVRAIRDQVGGTKAMAELLEVSDRSVRYWCRDGIKTRAMAKVVRGLVSQPEKA